MFCKAVPKTVGQKGKKKKKKGGKIRKKKDAIFT